MKKELEGFLREAPLVAPSGRLADLIDDAFRRADARSPRWYTAPIPLWACVAAGLACAALGFVARGKPDPPAVVYLIPVEGELRRVLNGETRRRNDDFYRGVKVSVTAADRKL